jgi:small subunit ribosomal protein S20
MPNKKSAMKELRKTEKRTARNRQIKRRLKELLKKVTVLVENSDKVEALKIYDKIQKLVDKASKNTRPFTKGTADRIKSRTAKKINAIVGEPKKTEEKKEEKKAEKKTVKKVTKKPATKKTEEKKEEKKAEK